MKFSLVSTVFNEAKRLRDTISDLEAQTVLPTEIIITDAGSKDGTLDILNEWKDRSNVPVIILQKKGCNVAEGRNMAINAATTDIIVSTDFGCRFRPEWLNSLTGPLNDNSIMVVGGAYAVDERDQDTLPSQAAYIMSDGYCVDVEAPWFIPSSRSIAYRKEVYENIGGYCEWLTLAADDLVFGKEILAKGYRFYPVNKPYVYWGRHKKAIGFIKEANRYGLGDGEAKVNLRNFLSTGIEQLFRLLLLLSLLVIAFGVLLLRLPVWAYCIPVLFMPGLRTYYYYTRKWLRFKSSKYNTRVFLYGFYLLEATKYAYIRGYIKGFLFATPVQKEQARILKKRLLAA
jgi:glycosyltransferase involved in cell wall biosynthesis